MNEVSGCGRVWIFVGVRAAFPSGVFGTVDQAEGWISKYGLTGVLTEYPVGFGVFDWAFETHRFMPKADGTVTAQFVETFTTATMPHHHYEFGFRCG